MRILLLLLLSGCTVQSPFSEEESLKDIINKEISEVFENDSIEVYYIP